MADRLKEIRERFALRDERGSMLTVGDFELLLKVAEAAEAYRVATDAVDRESDDAAALGLSLIQMNRERALFAALDGLKGGGNG